MKIKLKVKATPQQLDWLNRFAANNHEVLIAGLNCDSSIGLYGAGPNPPAGYNYPIDTLRSGEVVRIGLLALWPDGVRPTDQNAYILLQSPDGMKQWRVDKLIWPKINRNTPASVINGEPSINPHYEYYDEHPRVHGVVVQLDDRTMMEGLLADHFKDDDALPGPASVSSIVFVSSRR